MKTVKGFVTSFIWLCVVAIPTHDVFSQQQGPSGMAEAEEEGKFEITVKSQPQKTIRVESLILDRDLDKRLRDISKGEQEERRFYRVEPGGYLGFKESEWVDKLSFRAFNRPMTEQPTYKKYAELLSEITATMFQFKQTLGTYDQYAIRLIRTCDESQFASLQAVDAHVRDQLNAYGSLEKLRDDVVGALRAYTEAGGCKDVVREYQKNLKQSVQELVELSKKYRTIESKVNQMYKEVSDAERQSRERPSIGDQFDKTPLKY